MAQQRYEGNLLITTSGVQPCEVVDVTALMQQSEPPELVLLGTGTQPTPLSAELKAALKQHGLAYDIMDTGAACRTFNILLAEARRVAVFLQAI